MKLRDGQSTLIDATPHTNADASAHGTESDTDGVTPKHLQNVQ